MNLVVLKTYDNYFLANITCTKLQDAGIECFLRDENTVTVDPLISNAIGGIKLEVAEDDIELAIALMQGAEQAYLDDIVCPYCHTAGLKAEEKINKPDSFWGKLKNQIAYGQTSTYSKKYRCQHCKSLMDELPLSF